jgi:hypothetical protein
MRTVFTSQLCPASPTSIGPWMQTWICACEPRLNRGYAAQLVRGEQSRPYRRGKRNRTLATPAGSLFQEPLTPTPQQFPPAKALGWMVTLSLRPALRPRAQNATFAPGRTDLGPCSDPKGAFAWDGAATANAKTAMNERVPACALSLKTAPAVVAWISRLDSVPRWASQQVRSPSEVAPAYVRDLGEPLRLHGPAWPEAQLGCSVLPGVRPSTANHRPPRPARAS